MITVAVDIGGTFTDLIGLDDATKTFVQAKSLTTPAVLSEGIVDCINKSGLGASSIEELIHGSTIAINTLIERKGGKTALLVTTGTRDVYIIGRGNRPESYNLLFHRHRPLVSRRLTREVSGRMLASGQVFRELDTDMLEEAAQFFVENGVDSIAVCFLHAYAAPEHERVAGDVLRKALPNAYISLSHEILREYREYERMSTTVVNAYIGPIVGGYVAALKSSLNDIGFGGNLAIMRSNGGVMTPEIATVQPVAMMESGPVGGIIAAARVGKMLGYDNVISFDMGGTTAKASLIQEGEPAIAPGYHVGGYASGHPVMIPLVDIVEVGAGGGSIAWIDEVGAIKVGPQSSGAVPGPMCYGRGGMDPTITDANVVLGRLNPDDFLGGTMQLDASAATCGVNEKVAVPLSMDTVGAAQAIIQIAVLKMSLAVREVSVVKGYDPRDFVLIASGGAGPLHVLAIARDLHIPTVIVPLFPAHFSALGMLLADERHDFVRTNFANIATVDFARLVQIHNEMLVEGRRQLRDGHETSSHCHIDMRYVGQEFTISVPVTVEQLRCGDQAAMRATFEAMYEQRYAYSSPEETVEMVNVRLAVYGRKPNLRFPALPKAANTAPSAHRDVYFDGTTPVSAPVYYRDDLGAGAVINGPAIVQELGTTTVLFHGDVCTVAATGELIITVGAGQ